jgi:uncharacterized protein YbjT (DUF2867 family)
MSILVIGATGHVGGQVVRQLLAWDVPVRAFVRTPSQARLPDDVEVIAGDLTDPASLPADTVDGVFLLWPSFDPSGAAPVVDALAQTTRRLVYLSAMSVRDGQPPEQNGVWGAVEEAIERSDIPEWTFLRAGGFATNTLDWAPQIRTGMVRWPYGGAARSLIHERDIAAVAVHALIDDGHAGAKYVLTGPQSITQVEQARVIGKAIGRSISWEEEPPDEARHRLAAEWGNAAFADGALRYWASLVRAPEPTTDTVEAVTGRPARTFAEWAQDHADDFR